MTPAVQQFLDAIRGAGIEPPDAIEADGKLRRFSSNGKRGDNAGWYVLHDDGIPAGSFGDWRTGITQTWRAEIGRKLTPAEESAHRAKVEAMRREREAEEVRRHAEAREQAAAIWKAAQQAADDHPYLALKRIKSYDRLRVYRGDMVIKDMPCDGSLIVRARDTSGTIQTIEFIHPEYRDGQNKRFLPGGSVSGCYHSLGKIPVGDQPLYLAEGYATAASIFEATGSATVVAFDAGNMEKVARALRAKYPSTRFIICADDDYRIEGNPGTTKATQAARSVGGLLAVPDFGTDRPEGATDFNDLHQHAGLEAVKKQIEATRITYGGKFSKRGIDIRFTAGRPNYLGRRFIKLCRKAGEPFPVKRIQLRYPSGKK